MDKHKALVLRFNEVGIEDVPLVGGKNASLGEMYRLLTPKGVSIPNGFATTSQAYRYFMQESGISDEIAKILSTLDVDRSGSLKTAGKKIRELILSAKIPKSLEATIVEYYKQLSEEYGVKNADVAVRSSATAEDAEDASFAGQQETFLNVKGVDQLLEACRKCYASLFTDRAIFYRQHNGYDHMTAALCIGIQKMVRSDVGCSGVMFTLDTESGFRNVVLINGSYGLGENIVLGRVNPDTYYVFKGTLDKFRPIIQKKLGEKEVKAIYAEKGIRNVPTQVHERMKFCLSNDEVLKLARWGVIIENHYTQKKGKPMPMDMEWAKDGVSGKLFIVQARPETVHASKDTSTIKKYNIKKKSEVLTSGYAIGEKIAVGRAQIIKSPKEIGKFRDGDILITEITDPDWVPIMKRASAIITNKGGKTSHAAIVSRELGLPAIVGTNNATEKIKNGQIITISCAEGATGFIYKGELEYTTKEFSIKNIPKTRTKIMMNVGTPERAFYYTQIPSDGVGLAREEFIIGNYIKIHPMALVKYDAISKKNPRIKSAIDNLTLGYPDKTQFFIDKLAEGISMIAAAYYPNPVIVRFSDFKSNEYANLIGGSLFEPHEENPMLGWRGASRYYDPKYKEAFALECLAMKKVRDEYGLTNVKVMIPMCRTPEEGLKVIKVMEDYGLRQGKNGLEVYVMCEIPVNVIDIDRFAKVFDGFSIGSNDLTQMTMGLDRDSGLVAHITNETNHAVKNMIALAIRGARRNKVKIGICGEAPSNYPEIVQLLVKEGIDSISLEPDSVIKVREQVARLERKKR